MSGARNQDLVRFCLSQHSLLGLIFSKAGAPPIAVPGCCCCVSTEALSVRHRLFVLCFMLSAALSVSVEVTLGVHDDGWRWLLLLCVVLPSTCLVKQTIRRVSKALNNPRSRLAIVERHCWLRAEELLLMAFVLAYVLRGLSGDRPDEFLHAVVLFLQALLATWVAELCGLPWCFLFCRSCCACCVPPRDDFNDFTTAMPVAAVGGEPVALGLATTAAQHPLPPV